MMITMICKMCGGDLILKNENDTVCQCDFCNRTQTVPRADDEKKLSLFDRASLLRAESEFDKAAGIYETVVSEFPEEAEAYWGLVLCKYGIEYVDDPLTKGKIPTCHRSSFNSVFEDSDYKEAIEKADANARDIYIEEATQIESIRCKIIDISEKEEPYDVFICFKEHDEKGDRTPDSVFAQEVYDELTKKGYKVFFSRITLEDKLGQEFEPYIFAALHSSKIMLAFGTREEYYNSVWVKNEWSRYLQLIASGEKKTLIPCYADMEISSLPSGFSIRQAQNMAKLGWMQDLIRGIEKILQKNVPAVTERVIIKESSANPTVDSLLKRVFIFLEDGNWQSADEYAEKVLDIDPENALAYVGKLLFNMNVTKRELLANQNNPFDHRASYKKAIRYADPALKAELEGYNEAIRKRNKYNADKIVYDGAKAIMDGASLSLDFQKAAEEFAKIPDFEDAQKLSDECKERSVLEAKKEIYAFAMNLFNTTSPKKILEAKQYFEKILDYKDAAELYAKCDEKSTLESNKITYSRAISLFNDNTPSQILNAKQYFEQIPDYLDSAILASQCEEKAENARKHNICVNAQKVLNNNRIVSTIESTIKELEGIAGFENADSLKDSLTKKKDRILEEQRISDEEREKQRKKDTRKKAFSTFFKVLFGIIAVCAALCIVGGLIYAIYHFAWELPREKHAQKVEKYETAIAHFEEGEYEEAITLFTELDDFKKSEDKILEVKYSYAAHKSESGDTDGAYLLYCELSGYDQETHKFSGKPYLDSKEKRSEIVKYNPKYAQMGDTVVFGHYEQDNNTENGKEAIEWYVMENADGKLYLMSKNALDYQPWCEDSSGYHKIWSQSTIRPWLSSTFYNAAFTDEEKALIHTPTLNTSRYDGTDIPDVTEDKVFLIGIDEYTDENIYHFVFEDYQISEYAKSLGASDSNKDFWQRTPSSGGGAQLMYDALNNHVDTGRSKSIWSYMKALIRPCIYLIIEE